MEGEGQLRIMNAMPQNISLEITIPGEVPSQEMLYQNNFYEKLDIKVNGTTVINCKLNGISEDLTITEKKVDVS